MLFIKPTLYVVCAVQAEVHLRYRLREAEGVQYRLSLRNPSKDRQPFVDAILLISAPDWSETLSNFKFSSRHHSNSAFKRGKLLRFAKLRLRDAEQKKFLQPVLYTLRLYFG